MKRISCDGRVRCLALLALAGVCAVVSSGLAADAAGRTFYVDAETGQDGYDGQSPSRAWKSLERVNAAELNPGDTVRFRRGGVWRGSLVPVSGDDTAPVTYTSFGEG